MHFKLLGSVHLRDFSSCGDPDLEAKEKVPNYIHLGDVPVPPELERAVCR